MKRSGFREKSVGSQLTKKSKLKSSTGIALRKKSAYSGKDKGRSKSTHS
jgi:hypothetical protein